MRRTRRDRRARGPEPARLAATPRPRPGLPPLRDVALVAVGGALGAVARTALSARFPAAEGALPWSTLAENLTGAFALCYLLTMLIERLPSDTWSRPLLGTGMLGAYTTFATVTLELELLLGAGRPVVAAGYLAATWVGGLAAGVAGIALARRLPRAGRR